MTGHELKQKRIAAGIPGKLVCVRARIDRAKLSHLERGYIQTSDQELARISQVLEELIRAKQKLVAMAAECGWPTEAL
jgi:hypothetical protein